MSLRPIRLRACLAVVALGGLALSACTGTAGGGPVSGDTIFVVTSTAVWGSVVSAVGGDAVRVTALIDSPAADPHAYVDKPSDAATLVGAKLTVHNGGGYDDFFTRLIDAAGSDVERIEAFALSGKTEGSGDAPAEEASAAPSATGQVNEHVWYDLPTVRKVADRVAEELAVIAPDKKDTFTANARSFNSRIDELTGKVAAIAETHQGARVVATEPVAAYLVQAAGLNDVTPPAFTEAIEEETDPPAVAVAELNDLVAGGQLAAVINNTQTQTQVTRSVVQAAAQHGVPVVDLGETLPQGVTSYVDWMTAQVDAVAKALAAR